MKKRDISPETLEGIHHRIQNGEVTVRQAAAEIGVHHGTLKRKLEKGQYPTRPACLIDGGSWTAPLSIEEVRRAFAEIENGSTFTAVCKKIGIEICGLQQLGRRLGIEVKRKRPCSPFRPPGSSTDLAYLAGFLDGEGCVMPSRSGHNPSVCIYNTDPVVMEWVGSFGGFTYVRSPKGFGKRHQYGWHLNAKADVLRFLLVLLPYLKVKRRKALESVAVILGQSVSAIKDKYGCPAD